MFIIILLASIALTTDNVIARNRLESKLEHIQQELEQCSNIKKTPTSNSTCLCSPD